MENKILLKDDMKEYVIMWAILFIISVAFDVIYILSVYTDYIPEFDTSFGNMIIFSICIILAGYPLLYALTYKICLYENKLTVSAIFIKKTAHYDELEIKNIKVFKGNPKYHYIYMMYKGKKVLLRTKRKDEIIEIISRKKFNFN